MTLWGVALFTFFTLVPLWLRGIVVNVLRPPKKAKDYELRTVHHFVYCWNVNLRISSIHLSTDVFLICNLLYVFFIIKHEYEYEYETTQLCSAACPFFVILPFALILALLGYLSQQQLYYRHFQDNLASGYQK